MEANKIEIRYKRAKFSRRIFANIVDFILFIVSFICLFLLSRTIASANSTYKANMDEMNQIKLDSALYVEYNDGEDIIDIITFNNVEDTSEPQKVYYTKKAIINFVGFMKSNADSKETYDSLIKDIKAAALNPKASNDRGILFFMDDGSGNIIDNPDCSPVSATSKYERFYRPVFDEICTSYLLTGVPSYYALTKYMSHVLFFIEIPISYLVSGILIYYVPTLIFRKGRKTFGKAMYYIGAVDERLLNVTFGRSLARFSIFYFGELILSLFTFGIPIIVSFSLMAFSKNKQGFPDYLLGISEVDTSDNKIFDNYDDITIDDLKHSKDPIDFQMSRFD